MPRVESDTSRPGVDVVVPFAGSTASLAALVRTMGRLTLRDSDTLTIVDNRPAGSEAVEGTSRAPERQSSYFARNAGVREGAGPWLLFLDADVVPPEDLLDRYFAQEPAPRVAVLAGGVVDEPLADDDRASAAARYAMLRDSMSQEHTLLVGRWSYAQTANCAVRREAFDQVGGFRDHVRSGGDADLCFRLRAAGWEIEPRDGAAVVHSSRRSLKALVRQRVRHGAGAAWLSREHPGAFPRARWLGLAKWTVTSLATAAAARARGRRDDALLLAMEPLLKWAFELGRLFPNEVGDP
jgi:cellulose synthase/poly-beta-1,6-N-acetylglucosamine synthase-like glycosyltransferase